MSSELTHATLLLIVQDGKLLLAMKKRGFGAGKWNGPGGKIQPDETPEQACIRERQEEVGITPAKLNKVAEYEFIYPSMDKNVIGHIYMTDAFDGTPQESEEMRPQWFDIAQIPYDHMWQDDIYWLPAVLAGRKLKARFEFDQNNNLTSTLTKEVANFQ